MAFRVFTQSEQGRLDPASLVQNATRHFDLNLEVLGLGPGRSENMTWLEALETSLRVTSARGTFSGSFCVKRRPANEADWAAADRAEIRAQAPGMAALARRCGFVWEVLGSAGSGSPEETPAQFGLCAILASVGLGPVLSPDEASLFGVRGAMAYLESQVGRTLTRGIS